MSFLDRLRALVKGGTADNGGGMRPDMPTCEEALAVIYEFLDGELDGLSRDRIKAHFDVCGKCYPKLRFEESFRSAVQRASAGEAPPPDLRARLMEVLAGAQRPEGDS